MNGRVAAVWTKKGTGGVRPEQHSAIELLAGKGVSGDQHFDGRNKLRQVLLVDVGCLADLGLNPGDLREQVTVAFPGLQDLPPTSLVQIGEAVVKISGDCAPCRSMAAYLNENPKSFVTRAMRKRGMLGTVVRSGVVTVGDEVRLCGEVTSGINA